MKLIKLGKWMAIGVLSLLPMLVHSFEEEISFSEEQEVGEYLAIDEEELICKSLYTTHEGAFHRPVNITKRGESVTLQDGSMWKVREKDRYKTQQWLASDNILILPNHSWFSTYQFVFCNQNTGCEVRVNLILEPIYNGVHSHWIVAIDLYNQEICLEDGSIWKVSGSDYNIMHEWRNNDIVIIGVNDSWFSRKPNILINASNKRAYVTATCQK